MDTLSGSLSILENPAIIKFIFQGVLFTIIISIIAVLFSIVFGTVLALMRNYLVTKKVRIIKFISVAYIELFRNTPLLFWIFICVVFCPAPGFMDRKMFGLSSVNNKLMFKACVALILYTSAVIAEIVRGGLNSVASGQIEAGQSQGFSMVQIMRFIVLPQTFRAIIPTLLSQVITTIKDSSFLANVAVIELMARTKQVLSAANRYNGLNSINVSDVFVLFGLAAAIYFVINFSISMTVRKMQKKSVAVKVTKKSFIKEDSKKAVAMINRLQED
ncbi:putative glutamine transport system permease protein [Butyrivibrio fibrisolvens DSM 3071]|jgi:putative glutamine transport system permease protein|uniref:Putative glutamine transport system permease protein n=1 Tax=Butyrivibrio fibrisolvens DSM 3071 TaxID=1121131 RepID=A0A1M5ZCH9_BUTFI|nr:MULTISPECIES: amino acid ABC transporter permease [Butyrivibrio]MCR5771008.1 amino acid ABC transporter permease [Butyrivibrio sp.]SHI21937.1 putative glutamine transport system permease protein [Butyrivibrio fibrisolvens DSM 3071]